MPKLVSIVLPVYNGEKFLRFSIESVLKQTYQNLELIIVNDCSTDSTEEIALAFKEKDNRVVYIKNEINSKLPKSLNNGFARAKGDYCTWTSDDNLYHADAIAQMVGHLESNPDVGMVCCDYRIIDKDGNVLREVRVGEKNLIFANNIGACFLYRSEIAHEVGEYNTNLFLVEDYEYWLRINLHSKIDFMHECLYDYRTHGESLSVARKREVQEALARLLWLYLPKYESLPLDDKTLVEYFDYILQFKPNKSERIIQELKFAIRYKAYIPKLLMHLRNQL